MYHLDDINLDLIISLDVVFKGKVICRSFYQSTGQMPGWESKILQYWGEFRIDSTEMEMMVASQKLSNNSMQAGLRAARNICCSPRFPAVCPPPFSRISAVDYLTPHPLIPKPRIQINAEYWYCNIYFSFTSWFYISPTSFRFCALIQLTLERK